MWSRWNTRLKTTHHLRTSQSDAFVFAEEWFKLNAKDGHIETSPDKKCIVLNGGNILWSIFVLFGTEHSLWHEIEYKFLESEEGCRMECVIHFKLFGLIIAENTLIVERDLFIREIRYEFA